MPIAQAGFSLIEVVVALLVFNLGVLGLAATSALTARMLNEGHRRGQTVDLAQDRLEALRQAALASPACRGLANGTLTVDGIGERWAVSGAGPSRDLEITLSYALLGRVRTDTVLATVRCR
jgi:prepilin-type N-terminal cleavage/methylation domain-containing protein